MVPVVQEHPREVNQLSVILADAMRVEKGEKTSFNLYGKIQKETRLPIGPVIERNVFRKILDSKILDY